MVRESCSIMHGSHAVELASVPVGKSSVARRVSGLSGSGGTSWWPLRAREAEICSLVAVISASFLLLYWEESLIRKERAQCVGSLCQVCVISCDHVVGLVVVVTMASRGEMRMQLSQR